MLICKNFVLLNLPKTGSTFARSVIKEIFEKRNTPQYLKELLVPSMDPNIKWLHQHGAYWQIPKEDKDKTVVTVVRNPYEKFLSEFEYRWWAKNPQVDKKVLRKNLRHFPNLSLDEFALLEELTVKKRLNSENPLGIGIQTLQFFNMFFKEPGKTVPGLTKEYLESDTAYKNDIADIIFLRQENLNEELSQFLLNNRFTEEEVAYCKNRSKINETKKIFDERSKLWTQKALDHVEKSEKFMFKILADKGIVYDKPNT